MAPISGVLVGTSRESWENSILDIRVLLHGYFLHEYMFFFSEIVLQRDYFIERVELFEESSILLLSRRLGAC